MTREELLAQAEALEWTAKTPWPEYIDSRSAILAKASQLRAQAEAMPAAAPPSAAQPVAWCVAYDDPSLKVRIHSNPTMHKPEADAIAANGHAHLSVVDLYTAPPDLAARVKELERLAQGAYDHIEQEMLRLQALRKAGKSADPFVIWTHLNTIHNSLRAALAEGG